MKKVVVIGGGISGLATAYYIRSRSTLPEEELSITVLEKDRLPGGKMKSFHEEGYIVEWGPNGFLTNKPETLTMCRNVGADEHLYRSSDAARKRFVYSGGGLRKLPESPGEFFLSSLLSPGGRLRVAMEPLIRGRKDGEDETLIEFARRRLGAEAAEKLIEPMAAGIFAGNPDDMSLKSCFPLIFELEARYGSLVKGMLARMRERRGKAEGERGGPAGPGGILMSFDAGVGKLVEKILATGAFELLSGNEVVSLEQSGNGGFQVNLGNNMDRGPIDAHAVVVATPAYGAASILSSLNKNFSTRVGQISYAPIAVVAFGLEKKGLGEILDSFGFLVPRQEKRKVLGILFDSSIFPNRAPDGFSLLRGMIGGARDPHLASLADDELVEIMGSELEGLTGISAAPSFIRVYRHERGIPQYRRGHPGLLARIEEESARYPGIFLNSNAYRGIGLNDCVRNSIETAAKVVDFLQQ